MVMQNVYISCESRKTRHPEKLGTFVSIRIEDLAKGIVTIQHNHSGQC